MFTYMRISFSTTRPGVITVVYFVLVILFSSCGSRNDGISEIFSPSKFDEDDFAEQLAARYPQTIDEATWKQKKIPAVSEAMQYVYQANSYLPIWITEKGNTPHVEELLKELEKLDEEGLYTNRYRLDSLKRNLNAFRNNKEISTSEAIVLDSSFTYSYLLASRDLLLGRVRPSKVDSLWFHKNDTVWNAPLLLVRGFNEDKYISLDSFRSRIPAYKVLVKTRGHYVNLKGNDTFIKAKQAVKNDKKAVDSLFIYIVKSELPYSVGTADDTSKEAVSQVLHSFQSYYGLNPTGRIDDRTYQYLCRTPDTVVQVLNANLERLRWMPQELEASYIIVDVPLMELFLLREGKNVMQMNVVVGKTVRQTPSLGMLMTNVVFNPPWGVPPTILKKDVLPGMQKKGKAYLREKDLHVYDRKGNLVDASKVNASNYKQYVFKQLPGDDNALGFVKFHMPNDHDIYLHDTPHRDIFDIYDRAQSSGCVRVQKPRELAEYILKDMDNQRFDRTVIDSMIRTQKTKYQLIKNKMPVHVVYLTAFGIEEGEPVRFSRDIYKRDAKLILALQ